MYASPVGEDADGDGERDGSSGEGSAEDRDPAGEGDGSGGDAAGEAEQAAREEVIVKAVAATASTASCARDTAPPRASD